MTLEKDTLVGGKLRVVRTLGQGGMGAVYEVTHEITRHRRALKLLHADVRKNHPDIVRRFLREASVAGTLGNAHIVETFDAGELESGEPYVLMELLSGESLADRLAKGPLSVGHAVSVVRQMCEAMAAAHDKGIVHRDLKPDNAFLCAESPTTPVSEAGAPFVKILDFGISRFSETESGPSAQTSEGMVLGTPYYMPPEQARGVRDLDARADVYALGVILYEALAGRRPFEASSMAHLVVLIHEGKATPVNALRSSVPAALAEVVAKAMMADRDRRYPDARALSAALAPFVDAGSEEFATTQLEATAVAAPVPVPDTDLAIAPTLVADEPAAKPSTTLEPRASTLAEPAPAPGRSALVIGVAVAAALAIVATRSWLGTSPPVAATSPSVAPSTPMDAAASAVASTPGSVSVAAPSPSTTPPPSVSTSAPTPLAPSPKPLPKPSSSATSKSQQVGLTPDL